MYTDKINRIVILPLPPFEVEVYKSTYMCESNKLYQNNVSQNSYYSYLQTHVY